MVCKEEMNQRMPASRLKTGLSKSLPGTSDMGRRDQSHISTLSIQCTLNPQLHSLDVGESEFTANHTAMSLTKRKNGSESDFYLALKKRGRGSCVTVKTVMKWD